ncbi:hypothetical protein T484DRAFT_2748634 [Baffinella frigidus]|nr:hypothetical protein T484DRAFT_2748634 [Cryptophyta sp. CCMP2293]
MGSGLWVMEHGSWVVDCGLWVLGSGFWVLGSGLTSGAPPPCRGASRTTCLPLMGYGVWVTGSGLLVMCCGLWAMGSGVRVDRRSSATMSRRIEDSLPSMDDNFASIAVIFPST